ncbi:Scr1 family TA system antitoxin-like transcriptional regulator [Streptomyces luomodiensis]|uniref:Scr1 family TA system antitoxin-like transcriptional regulator n=1 Tax=Streptomyces luomodiensis TaxID=3026192 RepID=A0ABY9V4G2_9ACTN|nr:Scr1 family TA system antitoxin-like transcriptional regulator [Streptomyces sp. SCA4-21]WNE99668.1 Scr1 family TA system antitoxin-like transcriptional regulator [Streptomyces sp. SCA4-21]
MKTAFQGKIRPPREGEAPAAAALVVGAYLRAVRLSRGVSGKEAAWAIGGSAAKVSRLETGRLHRVADVIRLLEYYGIDGKAHLRAVDHLLQKPHRHVLHDAVPGWLDRLHACQRQADSTVIHTGHALPDFLRIPDYPVGLMAQHFRAELQLHVPPRAPLTAGTGEDVTLLLDEMGLHRPLGEPDVMPDQVAHLQQLTRSPQGPRILVVPQRVLPPRGLLLYQMTLHGHTLVAEERADFVIYHTGEALGPWQHRLRVAMDAAVPLDDAAVCVNDGARPR